MLTVIDVCAGVGGISLALEDAGMKVVAQVERDPFCQTVLRQRFPHATLYGDLREVNPHGLTTCDVLAGGIPCQPHSENGHRAGSADDRDLWPEFFGLIRPTGARFVLVENVRGLLSSEDGRHFGRILRDLAGIGFDAEWQVLPASAFGAYHRRERLFLLAYPDSFRRQAGGGILTRDLGQGLPLAAHGGVPVRGAHGRIRMVPPPGLLRVADGPPDRVDGLRAAGNGIYRPLVTYIGRLIEAAARNAA